MLTRLIKGTFIAACLFNMPASAYEGEAPRPFQVQEHKDIGLEVWVPNNPSWTSTVQQRRDTKAILLSTPQQYYPRSVIEILFHKNKPINPAELQTIALSAINQVRKSISLSPTDSSALSSVTYDDITGYQNEFDMEHDGEVYTLQVTVGMFPSGQPITLTLTTPKGQTDHISVMQNKIYRQLSALPTNKS